MGFFFFDHFLCHDFSVLSNPAGILMHGLLRLDQSGNVTSVSFSRCDTPGSSTLHLKIHIVHSRARRAMARHCRTLKWKMPQKCSSSFLFGSSRLPHSFLFENSLVSAAVDIARSNRYPRYTYYHTLLGRWLLQTESPVWCYYIYPMESADACSDSMWLALKTSYCIPISGTASIELMRYEC